MTLMAQRSKAVLGHVSASGYTGSQAHQLLPCPGHRSHTPEGSQVRVDGRPQGFSNVSAVQTNQVGFSLKFRLGFIGLA